MHTPAGDPSAVGDPARPDVRAFLNVLAASPLARLGELPIGEAREVMAAARTARPSTPSPGLEVKETSFEHGSASIALRCYRPSATPAAAPVIVYYHGGGFVLGDLDSHDELCRTMAVEMVLPVVSVDYRLAPEQPWPAAPDDAEAAARWIAVSAREAIGMDATGLILAGDSAGANLAAVTAGALRDRPAALPVQAQFLIYPCVTPAHDTRSMRENGTGYFLTGQALAWFEAQYAAPPEDPSFNLLVPSLERMPPTLVVTAGLDPLRDEGRQYAARLIEAGVSVIYQEMVGNIHGSFSAAAAIPSTRADIQRSLEALRLILGKRA